MPATSVATPSTDHREARWAGGPALACLCALACGSSPSAVSDTGTGDPLTDGAATGEADTPGTSEGTSAPGSTHDTSGTALTGGGDGSDGSTTEGATDTDTGGEPASRCQESPEIITCPKETVGLQLSPLVTRQVHFQVPLGAPPPSGWPVAFMFQGSLFTGRLNWLGHVDGPFGMYFQVLTLKRLLDAGYAVITPEAHLEGATFWDTNLPLYAWNWEASPDHEFMLAIFAELEQGAFGPIDPTRMYATGISSGGYMTSRMAVSYPGRFTALAIQSASYATCSGPLCAIPPLDPGHEPTLFLHGEQDAVVPIDTMFDYAAALAAVGVEREIVVDPVAGHAWIPGAPDAVLQWFLDHP